MDLLVLGIHGVFGERLKVLPTTQGTNASYRTVVNSDMAAIALTEHGSLHMGWL